MLKLVAVLAALASVVILAACGSDSNGSSTGSETSTASSEGGGKTSASEREQAIAAGTKAGEKAGKQQAPTGKTVAFLHLTSTGEADRRVFFALKTITTLFGYKVIDCDPNFDQVKARQCATTLIARHPDVIIAQATATQTVAASIKEAHRRGIPWITISAQQDPSSDMAAMYVPDERGVTKMLDDWMFKKVQERFGDEKGVVGAFQAPVVGPGVAARDVQRKEDLQAYPKLRQVTHDIDLADAVQDTIKQTKLWVQQHPDLHALWQTCDFCLPPVGQAVSSMHLAQDKRPVIGGIYSGERSRQMLLDGQIDGIVDIDFGVFAWMTMDQAIQNWATKKPFAKDVAQVSEEDGLQFVRPWIMTKENVGDPKHYTSEGEDYESFYRAKWKAEFGKS